VLTNWMIYDETVNCEILGCQGCVAEASSVLEMSRCYIPQYVQNKTVN